MWISAFAFIGAGFVGWGQYSYGDKATSVARVGDVEISMQELQETYSRLYTQYNQLFQGKFDEAQAKSFGLDKQALRMLINDALIANLANTYGLVVTDEELRDTITSESAFFKDGMFDKETYQKVLKQNNLTIKEFEHSTKRQMLIAKTQGLLAAPSSSDLESNALNAPAKVADTIEYTVLTPDMIQIDQSEDAIKAFWSENKSRYMTEPAYEIEVLEQARIASNADEKTVQEHYESTKHNYRDAAGKILTLEAARSEVLASLDDKATKTAALKQYIAYKKGELAADNAVKHTISASNNPFNQALLDEVKSLSLADPYIKATPFNDGYLTVKLANALQPQEKSFEAAKSQATADFIASEKTRQLSEMANNSVETFKGEQKATVTLTQLDAIDGLSTQETQQFIGMLFQQQKKRSVIRLGEEKLILVNILEQKMLDSTNMDQGTNLPRLKTALLNSGLIKSLEAKYPVEIYIEGL
jgi:peptidyl-prolyl cis-trans isomerase D